MDIKMTKNKRAQLTIFIIIATILVVIILLIFLLWRKPPTSISPEGDPESYIKECVKEATLDSIDMLSRQGGDIEPKNYELYKNEKIAYLCYTDENYGPCIPEEPLLIEHIEREITDNIELKVQDCFSNLRQKLEDKKYKVLLGGMDIKTELQSKRVIVTVNRKLEISKNEETRVFNEFQAKISDPIYDLAEIAVWITNEETRACGSDYLSYMLFYPQYDIKMERTPGRDDIKIYVITDLDTGKNLKFAVRGCVTPVR